MRKIICVAVALLSASAAIAQQPTFHNPLLPVGPDPWVISDSGFYYYTNSTGSNITLWKTRDITELAHAEKKVVWIAPKEGPYSRDIWAPELHRFDNKWYLYFAADDGQNENHRTYVLENSNPDPLSGEWTMKGKLDTVEWAIDSTAFEDKGVKYVLWSGWQGDSDGEQRIYIARL
ncbi:MAG TPA: family 43 glycosylhydrolase, partial [Acidobacteriaceae bacterium]